MSSNQLILETNRLILRPILLSDKEKVATQINEPETWFQLVIIEKTSEKIIGDIGIRFLRGENLQTEIGFTLNKQFQGKGYAVESVERVIDYLLMESGWMILYMQ